MCLIPEVNFALDGENGLMAYLKRLLAEKGHCVICVAEGAGQVLPLSSPFSPWPHTNNQPTSRLMCDITVGCGVWHTLLMRHACIASNIRLDS